MTDAPAVTLGAPGVYYAPVEESRALAGVRLDVCAFAGVTLRGPSWVPVTGGRWRDDVPWVEPQRPVRRSVAVPVESWEAFVRLYGDDAPGLLPQAVAAFFRQGGRRAYIVRVVHRYSPPAPHKGVARGTVPALLRAGGGDLTLWARDEGAWGNGLTARTRFQVTPLRFDQPGSTPQCLSLTPGTPLASGALLRLHLPGGAVELRGLASLRIERSTTDGRRRLLASLQPAASALPERAEVVEGILSLDDGDGRREEHAHLGFSPDHPRWIATVLCRESMLAWPDAAWAFGDVHPSDPLLRASAGDTSRFSNGEDLFTDIVPDDFFDAAYVVGDDEPRDGVHCLADVPDVSLLCVPDLYSPESLREKSTVVDPAPSAQPEFGDCACVTAGRQQGPPAPGLDGLRLDPRIPAELETIVSQQQRLAAFVEGLRTVRCWSFVALLDVPPGLQPRQILEWRAQFASSYLAAYHPWLRVPDGDLLATITPSAVAAGVIAKREAAFGVPFGPANEFAVSAVSTLDVVPREIHDQLHGAGVNVFVSERDGIRLTAARTLSLDPGYRQLSVRRLMTLLARTIENELQWAVFEPNTPALRGRIRQLLRTFLRRLFAQGAFRGANEDEAFFVRCDDVLNPPAVQVEGRLFAEIGVAAAEPLEFLVLRIARDHDGLLTFEG